MYVCGRAPRGMCEGQWTVGGSVASPTPCSPGGGPQDHEAWPQELLPAKPPKGQFCSEDLNLWSPLPWKGVCEATGRPAKASINIYLLL